eukprot:401664-Rhodomonas_salina.1
MGDEEQEVKDSGEQREEAKERAKSMAEGSEEGKVREELRQVHRRIPIRVLGLLGGVSEDLSQVSICCHRPSWTAPKDKVEFGSAPRD